MATYARVAVARSAAGWTVSGNTASLFATQSFPQASTGSTVATYFGVGRDSSSTGELLFFGALANSITINAGVTPQLSTSTNVQQSTGDGMADTAANNLMKLIFNNTTWANIGDVTGIVGSGTAGSLYLSLHTSSPGEAGDQTTNEVSYT